MSSEIEDNTKEAPPIETTPAPETTGASDIGSAEATAEAEDLNATGLDESEKDDEAGATFDAVVEETPAPREPGVNRAYGKAGETGSQAFQRQHREATGQEPSEPV